MVAPNQEAVLKRKYKTQVEVEKGDHSSKYVTRKKSGYAVTY
jgi:hypothetical protein